PGSGQRCDMSIGVIAAQALDEDNTAILVAQATRDLARRLGHAVTSR
ncbi:MAG: hypothetical protein JWM85_511, partial [Acidimicrobiaceae bacterium]|nr:hypothetical protein [Acidimicrobiaceae bacterium]